MGIRGESSVDPYVLESRMTGADYYDLKIQRRSTAIRRYPNADNGVQAQLFLYLVSTSMLEYYLKTNLRSDEYGEAGQMHGPKDRLI
jgi:hypothetical protein